MTPAEHLLEGERLLALAQSPQRVITGFDGDAVLSAPMECHNETVAMAQAHFTAALVGATILGSLPGYDTARNELGDAITGTNQ